jgi:hypothetical protein
MMDGRWAIAALVTVATLLELAHAAPAQEPFRRDPGHPQWHHNSFQDHRDAVRKMTHELLHSRAQVPLATAALIPFLSNRCQLAYLMRSQACFSSS